MMASGKVQKLIEAHLRMVIIAPKRKRLEVFNHQAQYLAKLTKANGALGAKILRAQLLSRAIEVGIDGKGASFTITEALQIKVLAVPENQTESRSHVPARNATKAQGTTAVPITIRRGPFRQALT